MYQVKYMCNFSVFWWTKTHTWKINISLWNCNFLSEDWKVKFPCMFHYGKLNLSVLSNNFPYHNQALKESGCGFIFHMPNTPVEILYLLFDQQKYILKNILCGNIILQWRFEKGTCMFVFNMENFWNDWLLHNQ